MLPLKHWVDWITTRQEKMPQPLKCTFWEEVPKIKKKQHVFPLMTTFYNFILKIKKPVEFKKLLNPYWELEMSMMLLCISGLFISR